MMENPMTINYTEPEKYHEYCPNCKGLMFKGETLYLFKDKWMCDECLEYEIRTMGAAKLASEFDLSTKEIEGE